jgi:hypothetical protein
LPQFTDQRGRHGSWFLFNDELVTKINGLGDGIPQKQSNHRETAKEDEKWVIRNVVLLLLIWYF